MRIVYFICLIGIFSGLTGCAPPVLPPAFPAEVPPPPKRDGRIYQPGYTIRLYQDKIAYRVGDILTVILEESTKGEYRAATKTDKKASLSYPAPIFFGQRIPALEVNTDTKQIFDGKGTSDQSNKLYGRISVTVVRVLANGNLIVQGESWVTISQGQEMVQLSGIVRPQDISFDNTVSSQRIANARIIYGSFGQAGYATSGGLITRLFNWLAPY